MMHVTINGVATDVADGDTVAAVVTARTGQHDRVAVALNGAVVPRSAWDGTALAAGDLIEVLTPVAGG